jgi:hypothetical protein
LRVSGILVVIEIRGTSVPSEGNILVGKVLKLNLSLSSEVKFHPKGVGTALADPCLPVNLRLYPLDHFSWVLRGDPLVEEISQLNVGDAGQLVSQYIVSDEVLEVQL